MNIEFDKDFFKTLKKLNNPALKRPLNKVIDKVEKAKTISDIPNVKKLENHAVYYRIRMGNYRIGVTIIADTVTFIVIGLRKDIYRMFP